MKSVEIKDGRVIVSEQVGQFEGQPTGRRWDCPPEQAEKHLPSWNSSDQANKVAAGDVSAIQDMANEARKQRES